MTPITTKSTRERIIRNALVAAMMLAYSGWSFYDGFIGYPEENLARARTALPAEAQDEAKINDRIVVSRLHELQAGDILRKGKRLSDIEAELGPPSWQGPAVAEERNAAYWFGPAGTLIVRYGDRGILTNEAQFKPAPHTEKDLFIQKLMGICVGAIGLYALIRVLAMLATNVQLSDAGLKTPKGTLISFDAMTGWDPSDFKDKGRIKLSYDADGREKSFILDDYKIAAFRPIVDEICARKDFMSPFEEVSETQPKPDSADASAST